MPLSTIFQLYHGGVIYKKVSVSGMGSFAKMVVLKILYSHSNTEAPLYSTNSLNNSLF
jgi:hypothetical protein